VKQQGHLTGNLLLLLAALVWGCSFVAQSVGMDHVGPFTFQATRSLLGAISLMPIIWLQNTRARRAGRDPKLNPQTKKALLWGGLLCGLVVTVAVNLQQYAMQDTGAGKAGFLTTLYILFVPVAGMLLLGERLSTREAIGCALMFLAILLSQWAQAPRGAKPLPADA